MPQVTIERRPPINRCFTILALMGLALVLGCSGAIGQKTGAGDGGADGGQAPGHEDGPLPGSPDTAPPTNADTGPGATGCPNGNLLAAYPALPALCRPFAPVQPGPLQQEPATCLSTPLVTLSDQPNQFTGTGTVKDWINGMGGDDVLKGMECSDNINGNMGADWISGNMGNDQLRGGAGGDKIHGGAGSDVIYGGGGDDSLVGGLGDDKFFYAEGAGHDTVEDGGGHDTVVCAANGTRPRARLLGWSRVGNDLLLTMSGSGSIRIKQHFAAAVHTLDAIVNCQ